MTADESYNGAPHAPGPLDDLDFEEFADRIAEHLTARAASRRFLDVHEAAAYLSCGESRILALVDQRTLTFYRDGDRLLFRESELAGYLEVNATLAERL